MELRNSRLPMDRILSVIGSVRRKGVHLWAENGQLRYKAPRGALTPEELAQLARSRSEIVDLLERNADAELSEPRLLARTSRDRAPLSFAQLAHWRLYDLRDQPSFCLGVAAVRLQGKLNVTALRGSIREMVRRHEVLRTRVIVENDEPVQVIAESCDLELVVSDLTQLPEEAREAEVSRITEAAVLLPIDISSEPLARLKLLKLFEEEHILVLVMEHIITDQFSVNVLLRDIFTGYKQALQGRPFAFPNMPMQLSDYAVWQRSTHQAWLERHGPYWHERAERYAALRLPSDLQLQISTHRHWGSARVHIDRSGTEELSQWCRGRGTTLVMGAFTAYVALILRWCAVSRGVFLYQWNGRTSAGMENSLGYFASALYVYAELAESGNFLDLLQCLTEEYCKAYEHADYSYWEAQVNPPEFTRNTCFNWLSRNPGLPVESGEGLPVDLVCSKFPLSPTIRNQLGRDTEPYMALGEHGDVILGAWNYPSHRFSSGLAERIRNCYSVFLQEMIRNPQRPIRELQVL